MATKAWIPLESNPEVLTRFGHRLGLNALLQFSDVWGLDLLNMVPSPRYAVLLLFPLTPTLVAATSKDEALPSSASSQTTSPFFCRQTIGNACGTIALLHAAINGETSMLPLVKGSFLSNFANSTRNLSPIERASALERDDMLDQVHEQFAQEGQTAVPAPHDKIDMHFVCFVHSDGVLVELDGRKDTPVSHGPCTPDSLLEDATHVIKDKFMQADPSEHRFTILALTMNSA